jgi:hypothetical protein
MKAYIKNTEWSQIKYLMLQFKKTKYFQIKLPKEMKDLYIEKNKP